jgi:2-methylisocitrate lyase-like PEP mutase family enzyme
MGWPDYLVTLADVLSHLNVLCDAVDLQVNADFESCFAREPDDLAINVTKAIATGVSGLSIEDREIDGSERLFDVKLSVARMAIDQSGQDVLLVVRTEQLLNETYRCCSDDR